MRRAAQLAVAAAQLLAVPRLAAADPTIVQGGAVCLDRVALGMGFSLQLCEQRTQSDSRCPTDFFAMSMSPYSTRGNCYCCTVGSEPNMPRPSFTTYQAGPSPPPGATCSDTNGAALDTYGDDCDYYATGTGCSMGLFDDADFTAAEMCCGCGGGSWSGGAPAPPPPPPPPTTSPPPSPPAPVCTCANGVPATGSACDSDGAQRCASCADGFVLDTISSSCIAVPPAPPTALVNTPTPPPPPPANVCTCKGGTPLTGASCPSNGAQACASCANGFRLSQSAICVAQPPILPGTVSTSLTLPISITAIPAGSAARDTFEANFKADVADLCSVDVGRVRVLSISAGSAVVNFAIAPATSGAPYTTSALLQTFSSRVELPSVGATTENVVAMHDVQVAQGGASTRSFSPNAAGTVEQLPRVSRSTTQSAVVTADTDKDGDFVILLVIAMAIFAVVVVVVALSMHRASKKAKLEVELSAVKIALQEITSQARLTTAKAVNAVERLTGVDLDGDGDIGVVGTSHAAEQNAKSEPTHGELPAANP